MATFYLDPEGGNDGNDGTTYANRWQTVISGATAARIAPGDTIRIIGSPPKTNTGVDATWTNGTSAITLSTALNALITDCETAWTGSANVTATASTSFVTGTRSCSLAIAAGFTTGKVAYFDLGSSQDYSGYQGITFWFQYSATIASGALDIKLCSDATGDTVVDTIALPAQTSGKTSVWFPVYLDKGSALGSSIRSIAIYANTDPGTLTILLDNISTVKAKGSSQTDNLNLTSLVSKNTTGELWYALRSINGTAVGFDNGTRTSGAFSAVAGWYGTSETVALYKWETVKYPNTVGLLGTQISVQDSGSVGLPITFSGGWNRSDMTYQDSESWLDGSIHTIGWSMNNKNYITLEKINLCRWYYGLQANGDHTTVSGPMRMAAMNFYGVLTIGDNLQFDAVEVALSLGTAIHINGSTKCSLGDVTTNAVGSSNVAIYMATKSFMTKFGAVKLFGTNSGSALHCFINQLRVKMASLEIRNTSGVGLYVSSATNCFASFELGDVTITGGTSHGVSLVRSAIENWRIKSLTCQNNTGSGVSGSIGGIRTVIGSLTTSGNNAGLTNGASTEVLGNARILVTSMTDSTPRSASSAYVGRVPLRLGTYLGGAERIEYGQNQCQITSESGANRHTASGLGWKFTVADATEITATYPIRHRLARMFCKASSQVTVRLWVNRSNTAITAKLVVPGGQIAGVPSDVVDTSVATASTWEELEVLFTPSEAGMVEAELWGYGGSSHHFYFDDMTITQ